MFWKLLLSAYFVSQGFIAFQNNYIWVQINQHTVADFWNQKETSSKMKWLFILELQVPRKQGCDTLFTQQAY